jgi:FkbM family methyltransferase
MILKKVLNRLRGKCSSSEHELMVKKWYADGGDYELRFNYDLGRDSVVLDIGGYQGQWTSDLFSRYRCQIYVFEPVTTFSNQIVQRFIKNHKIEVFPFGLGSYSRKDKIHINADGSSIFGTSNNCEEIEILDVKDWIKKRGLDKIDLMKINIEGGEYELLDRLIDTHLIKTIGNIQVQFHDFTKFSSSKMESIQKKLKNTHKPTYQYKFVWENWTRLV